MAKKNSPYFNDFITMVEFSVRAAEYLQSVLTNFDAETLSVKRREMHDIEHAEDNVRHGMMKRLVKEFVTPIDREDIIQLANVLDTVTDKIDDILTRMYIYNVKEVQPAALKFGDVIVRCCKTLQTAMIEFPNFQKSKTLLQAIIEVNTMEEEADALYVDVMHELYQNNPDPKSVVVWSALYEQLEDCCDACEDAADMVQIIVMKNA